MATIPDYITYPVLDRAEVRDQGVATSLLWPALAGCMMPGPSRRADRPPGFYVVVTAGYQGHSVPRVSTTAEIANGPK